MSFSMASLLVHSPSVPAEARQALAASRHESPTRRKALLESAARILYRELGVECADACELVDLAPCTCR
jgi:hypothetical protein